MKDKSYFLVIDGIDGCGGTTHSNLLKDVLESKGFKVHLTQEPSSSDIGILLRKYLKDKKVPPATDALLFAADRVIHYYNEIKEKLNDGYIVISDRYLESSIAYQSAQSDEISIEWVEEINKFAEKPDLTIILDIDPKIALARKSQDNLEKFEDTFFLDKVRKIYLKRAKEKGYYIINSNDSKENVQNKVLKLVFGEL